MIITNLNKHYGNINTNFILNLEKSNKIINKKQKNIIQLLKNNKDNTIKNKLLWKGIFPNNFLSLKIRELTRLRLVRSLRYIKIYE